MSSLDRKTFTVYRRALYAIAAVAFLYLALSVE